MAEAKAERKGAVERPLSPHLQIYRMSITMTMSIWHRITGVALYFGTLLLAWWLIAAASGPKYFAYVSSILGSWPGRLVLLGFTWSLIHHALGGIRHFIWDTGRGLDVPTASRISAMTIIGSLLITALIWAHAYGIFGALLK
jgi:succinate dehydrogenase / fumarate reductase cytochrome b subunit